MSFAAGDGAEVGAKVRPMRAKRGLLRSKLAMMSEETCYSRMEGAVFGGGAV